MDLINTIQSLPIYGKLLSIAALYLAATIASVLIWQTPKGKEESKNLPPVLQTVNKNSVAGTSHIDQHEGQIAGKIENNYPPASLQDKTSKTDALKSDLEDLAEFPMRKEKELPSTLLQQMLVDQIPWKLNVILSQYHRSVIDGVTPDGKDLYSYRKDYYNFEEKERVLEASLTKIISENVAVRYTDGWNMYLRYFILRTGGETQDAIARGANFLNYGVTYDDCERVYKLLSKDNSVSQQLAPVIEIQQTIAKSASLILGKYKT